MAVEQPEVDFSRALAALDRVKKTRSGCLVIGCRTSKRRASPYCKEHYKSWKLGLIEGDTPLHLKEKIRMALQFVADKVSEIRLSKKTEAEVKDEFFTGLSSLLSTTKMQGKLDYQSRYRVDEQVNTPEFIKLKREARKRKDLDRRTRYLLKHMPVQFQVSRVTDDGGVLSLTIGTRVDQELDGKKGYLDNENMFIEKKALKTFFERVFSRGDILTAYVDNAT
jgi:hypothetical protein